MWKNLLKALIVAFSLTLVVATPSYAQDDAVYTSWRNNIAVSGYDTVSYHQGNPTEGSSDITTDWNGAVWQFSTQANLDTFLSNPEKYAPAYGGYCAWALANDKLAKGDPEQWTVKDGRLFLNYNGKIKKRWLADQDKFIVDADQNWPTILE